MYYIYLCGITFVHKRVLNYHIYRWKWQNNNCISMKSLKSLHTKDTIY